MFSNEIFSLCVKYPANPPAKVSHLASFCVEKFGTERMITLDKKEVVSRLQQFKSLTQFDIEL